MSRVELDQSRYREAFEDYVGEARSREVRKHEEALSNPPDRSQLARGLRDLLGEEGEPLARAAERGDGSDIADHYRLLFKLPVDRSDYERARATSRERMRLSDALDALRVYLDDEEGFTQDPGADWDELREKRLRGLAEQGAGVSAALEAAVSRCEGFSAWPVRAVLLHDEKEWAELPGVYEVKVGRGTYGTPSFTLFVDDKGSVQEVEDVLEGGDTDFFSDPATQADYFNLVNELRKPGSSARGRTLKLYTARPTRDRARYEGARELPANVFLTTRLDEAEGLARDLGGSEVRDVWSVRVNERHLVLTLEAGAVRHYQTIRPTPADRLELVVPGGKTARLKDAFRVRDLRTDPQSGWWLFEEAGGTLTVRTTGPREERYTGEVVAHGDPSRKELDLDADVAGQQVRYPGLSNLNSNNQSRDSYPIPYGSSALAGEPRKARQMFRDLLRAGVVAGDWKIVNSPHYRGMTVGQAGAEIRPDPVDQITHGTTGRVTFYHGTSKKRWEELRVKGLKPGSSTGFDEKIYIDQVKGYSNRNVYLTTSIPEAEKYATRAALRDRSTAVVLEVVVEDLTRFVVDEDAADMIRPADIPSGMNLGLEPGWQTLYFKGPYIWYDSQGLVGFGDWRSLPSAPVIEQLFQDKTYQGLRKNKTVAYRGAIPARNLKVIESYKPVRMKNDPKYDHSSITREEFMSGMEKVRSQMKSDNNGLRRVASPEQVAARHLGASLNPDLNRIIGGKLISLVVQFSPDSARAVRDDPRLRDPFLLDLKKLLEKHFGF